MYYTDLPELAKITGWKLLNPNNIFTSVYLPQITYGDRNDERNFACCWWDNSLSIFRLAATVDGKVLYRDKRLKYKKIETIVKWVRKCEYKFKKAKMKSRIKSINEDFR